MGKALKIEPPKPIVDEFGQYVMNKSMGEYIGQYLNSENDCFMGLFDVGGNTAFNVIIACYSGVKGEMLHSAMKIGKKTGESKDELFSDSWQGGYGHIYIGFERYGGFTFRLEPGNDKYEVHPGYINEKFGGGLGTEICQNMSKFLLGIQQNLST